MKTSFDHEKLAVYREAIRFVGLVRSTSSDRVHEERVEYEAGDQ